MPVDERVKKYFNESLQFDFVNFFYSYCEAAGYDDPECNENMTDDLYTELEKEVDAILTPSFLANLQRKCSEEIMEIVNTQMRLEAKKKGRTE